MKNGMHKKLFSFYPYTYYNVIKVFSKIKTLEG